MAEVKIVLTFQDRALKQMWEKAGEISAAADQIIKACMATNSISNPMEAALLGEAAALYGKLGALLDPAIDQKVFAILLCANA